jgi:hypothetical protein
MAFLIATRSEQRLLDVELIGVQLLADHPGVRVDVEHGLDAGEIRRRAGFAREVVRLEQVGVEHRHRHLGDL